MKVHFAGLESLSHAIILGDVSRVRYGLFTVFPFIYSKSGIKKKKKTASHIVPKYLDDTMVHSIMDSGLFTLMFGAQAGPRDEAFMDEWLETLVWFVKESGYQGTCVEVDCQKILGVKQAWKYRKQMKGMLRNQQINVYHHEDGKKGFDRMIEFSDYIAISVPELRVMRVKNLPEYVQRQAAYAMNRKPELKIHLLGCTSEKIMKACNFCYSCDSTSWQQVNRWSGGGQVFLGDRKINMNRRVFERNMGLVKPRVDKVLTKYGVGNTDPDHNSYSNFALTAIELLKWYEHCAGSQR